MAAFYFTINAKIEPFDTLELDNDVVCFNSNIVLIMKVGGIWKQHDE